jgi:hypothetical protein
MDIAKHIRNIAIAVIETSFCKWPSDDDIGDFKKNG